MVSTRLFAGVCTCASLAMFAVPAAADTYAVILRGKVIMKDGSPPPKTVGIQRICSDTVGDAPGPITNKKGEYTWRMDFDNELTRVCRLEATLPGYVSTGIDISDLNGFISNTKDLPPLVLSLGGADPRTINQNIDGVPGPARPAWKAMGKALAAGDVPDTVKQLRAVTEASPKFTRGWHALGIALEIQGNTAAAQEAYTQAVNLDPKDVLSWVTLSRVDVLNKDYEGALKAADNAQRLDAKHIYSEIYLHRAVAQYQLKQYDAAEASVQQLLKESPGEEKSRGEFIMGMILAAKKDYAGAKAHIAKYLQLNPDPADLVQIRAYSDLLGTPDGASMKMTLEY